MRTSASMKRLAASSSLSEGVMTESGGLDDAYKLALGELVIETSRLESKLTDTIAALVGMEIVEALILVHPAPFAQKLDMLTALYRLVFLDKDDPEYAPIKEMLERITAVSEFRNSVVHALWQIDENGVPQAVRFRRRGILQRSELPAPIENVREYTREAIALAEYLDMLSQVYRELAKMPPQPKE
jgi:hypothetical protein